jgi:CIC family chloride channel protein
VCVRRARTPAAYRIVYQSFLFWALEHGDGVPCGEPPGILEPAGTCRRSADYRGDGGFTVLTLKRSILTEKVARRGFHLSREYAVDPLELLYVREVMEREALSVPSGLLLREVLGPPELWRWQLQRLLPVVDGDGRLAGVLTSGDLYSWQEAGGENLLHRPVIEVMRRESLNAYPDEPLRIVVNRMAESGFTRMPVVDEETQKLLGLVTLEDLLKGRTRHVGEERHREQVIRFPYTSQVK